jgi:protein-tyrosine phosphatase
MTGGLYWVDGPWPGRLAVAARPRGGDWLHDEIAKWKRAGVDAVLSLLESEEENNLDLRGEAGEIRTQGLKFWSLPVADRQPPRSETQVASLLETIGDALSAGNNVVVHCRQGVGRSGLIAACLLVKSGMSPGAAVDKVSAARGVAVPETDSQRDWIDHFATALTK